MCIPESSKGLKFNPKKNTKNSPDKGLKFDTFKRRIQVINEIITQINGLVNR